MRGAAAILTSAILVFALAYFTTGETADAVDRSELRELVRRGDVVVEDGVYFAPEAIDAAGRLLAELLADKPDGVTVSEVRQAMGNTRKHAMPLLAMLGAQGMTRRRENLRIAGPRLPDPS